MKVKMIIEGIVKALLKSKIIYSFELIYNHGLVFGITSWSVFLLRRPKSVLLAGLAKSLLLKKCFCFHQDVCFSFFYKLHVNFRKTSIVLYMKRRSFFIIKLQSFKLRRSVFSRLEISKVLIALFVVFLNGIFSLSCRGKWEW